MNLLPDVQVKKNTKLNNGDSGWFWQKTKVNQEVEWSSIQLDQTAMPIMLSGMLRMDKIFDHGFIELVSYGVMSSDEKVIEYSLKKVDDQKLEDKFRVRYDFKNKKNNKTFPGFRRYGMDRYGEGKDTGQKYGFDGKMAPDQRGRIWTHLTGERGMFELQKLIEVNASDKSDIKDLYIMSMEQFANESFMLPELVWDGIGNPTKHNYKKGKGNNSATPLAWLHAEYLKLLRSYSVIKSGIDPRVMH